MKLNNLGSNKSEVELTPTITVFFSYNTPVAACVHGKYYRTEEFFSVTTSKHINQWLEGINAEKMPQKFFENLIN